MRNRLAMFLLSLTLILGFAVSASAYGLNNWYFDFDGDGDTTNAKQINEFFDLTSPNFVDTEFTSAEDFNFTNYGVANLPSADGGALVALNYGKEITSKYTFNGTGTLTGDVTFTGGTFDMFLDSALDYEGTAGIYGADNGTPIATFNVAYGSGSIDAEGLPNGDLSITYQAANLAPGYFYMPDGTTDMASFDASSVIITMGYTTTNATAISNPTALQTSEIYQEWMGNTGTATNDPPDDFWLNSNGQFRVDVVPEPSTMILFGAGLLGLAAVTRRKFSK